ncbi:MAG: hypothetical protein IJX48_07045 [Paludibacteraceae bacterium]|nr:hypothetical protein [Paludibacteraceae bacterium]
MKKFFFAALAVATVALVGCEPKPVDPIDPEPGDTTVVVAAPTAADLADYEEEGNFVACVHFAGAVCNDIVFAGSYNGWATDPASMVKFEALEGFDGWYVAVVPVTVVDGVEANDGKPAQLADDGSFSWDYQTGDVDSWELVSGTVDIVAGYSGESDLKNWNSAEPVILKSLYWKNNQSPCVEVVEQEYTITLKAPDCGGFEPAIIGDFNGWTEGVAMELQADGSYKAVITSSAGKGYKFKATTDTDWSNQIQHLVKNEETGEDEWKDLDNCILGEEVAVSHDFSTSEYKYSLCE